MNIDYLQQNKEGNSLKLYKSDINYEPKIILELSNFINHYFRTSCRKINENEKKFIEISTDMQKYVIKSLKWQFFDYIQIGACYNYKDGVYEELNHDYDKYIIYFYDCDYDPDYSFFIGIYSNDIIINLSEELIINTSYIFIIVIMLIIIYFLIIHLLLQIE